MTASITDPRVPPPDECILRYVLGKWAERQPDENISSFEVEVEVDAFDVVRESAAVPVAIPDSEDEVLVVVAPVAGGRVDPAALFDFLVPAWRTSCRRATSASWTSCPRRPPPRSRSTSCGRRG